ncbi:MAG: ATP-binding protein [Syntrophobacteraceae bacterium]|nr:ATP-binding protein [Syntrophobacteraceae bacterium]
MKLEFRHKIFLAFLLNSTTIVACILLIGSYYGQRHFRGYLARVEAARIAKLADTLGREYRKKGDWNAVLRDPEAWTGLKWFVPGMAPPRDGGQSPAERRPASGMGPGAAPPFPEALAFGEPEAGPPGPPPDGGNVEMGTVPGGPFGPPPNHLPSGPPLPPVALFDARKRPLAPPGDLSSPGSYRLTPVKVSGRVVGWVGFRKFGEFEGPTHHLDVEFIRRQSQTFYATGFAVLVLAGFATFVLSRRLLAPVRELERGIEALAARRFDTRIVVNSGDELGRLAAGFNAMAQALDKHQLTRRQWLVDISHELRTPLAVLRAEVEAMQDGVRSVTEQGLDSLHQEVLHLGRIVGDLHDLSLIEAGAFSSELSAVNAPEILVETLDCFRTRLELRSIRLDLLGEAREAVEILADPGRLKQLFSNLLENVLRYSDAPGSLKVSHRVEQGQFFVSFEDSGPGVPEESLPRLFDRLYRVDGARTREKGGSGLGLSICKSIVEGFSGKIVASNSIGGGLKIAMSFPLHLGPGD